MREGRGRPAGRLRTPTDTASPRGNRMHADPTPPARRPLAPALALALLAAGLPSAGQETPRTGPEISGYTEYTTYGEMMDYLGAVQASGTEMRLGIYGETRLGRELPYAVFARPSVTRPWEAWALGKPILVLAANVHGDERTFRESLLLLLRDLATPGTEMNGALDQLTILVVPQLNPDGFSTPDPQRGNIWGLDLNRDYMKLEQPEIRSYVQNILLPWAPHLFVDGHNGGSYPYNLNYQCPSHTTPDARITELCDERIFPAIDEALGTEGYRAWYYQRGDENRWDVGGSDPRIGRNYGGFSNMVGILFESPRGQSMADGVRAGVIGYETVVRWARDNAGLLAETVRRARIETAAGGGRPGDDVPIEVAYLPGEEPVTYLIPEEPGDTGAVREIRSDSLMIVPVTTLARPRPWAYVLPPDAEAAVDLLADHGIQVEILTEDAAAEVEIYLIGEVRYEQAYNHEAATKIDVAETVRREETLSRGSYLVRTRQMRGRVAAHLLEAETRDGVVYWNRMDPWIPKTAVEAFRAGEGPAPEFPVWKLMEPTPLPTRLLP